MSKWLTLNPDGERKVQKRGKKNLFTVRRSNMVDMMLYNMIDVQEGKEAVFGDKRCRFKDKKIQQQDSATSASLLWKKAATCSADSVRRPHVHPLPHPDWLNDWVSSWADCSRGAASTELLNISEESLEATACAAAADLCLIFSKHKQYQCLPSERASEWMNADERLVLPDYCR